MKTLVLFLLIFLLPFCSQSKSKYSRRQKDDFLKFSFGPEIGGRGYLVFRGTNEVKFYGEYNLGGTFEIRPIRAISLNSGLSYNKIMNGSSYFSTPVLLGIYGNNMAFFGGPVLYSVNNNGKLDFNKQKIGGSIGFGSSSTAIFLTYNPNNPFFQEGITDTKFFIGIGIGIKLGLKIGFISLREFGLNI